MNNYGKRFWATIKFFPDPHQRLPLPGEEFAGYVASFRLARVSKPLQAGQPVLSKSGHYAESEYGSLDYESAPETVWKRLAKPPVRAISDKLWQTFGITMAFQPT